MPKKRELVIIDGIEYARCSKCKQLFPATTEYFFKNDHTTRNIGSACKECERAARRENYTYEKGKAKREQYDKYYTEYRVINREKRNQQKKANYEAKREYYKAKFREYYKNNKEQIAQQAKEYREKNKEKIKERITRYYKSERGKFIISKNSHIRKARAKALESNFTQEEWEQCKAHFNNKCAYCGKEEELTQEHFIPLFNGGEYTKNNIIPACKSCNCSKQNQEFFKWYPAQKFYSKKRENKILKYLHYSTDADKQQLALII